MDTIKVFLVEDDPDWVSLLVDFLEFEPDIRIALTAANKQEAVEKAAIHDFNVIIMDINLNETDYDGIDAASEILKTKNAKIIMLTSFDEDELIIKSFSAGAVEYLRKMDYQALPHIIRSVNRNRTPVEVLQKEHAKLKRENTIIKELSRAEREIFELKSQGYTLKDIMIKLNKSERTLKNQVGMILKKLNVKSLKEALEKMKP
ncbi:response regulator transcription factor [Acetivibrio cellulolyticus]|uniref:response regulator transcription factor n=1 Tax=Acetivibrio cellulolyticus TaxID=35830 RepID=UPI0001E2CC3B|nr:response regulator transcription factor [Acetivibrio cellulolyticus]